MTCRDTKCVYLCSPIVLWTDCSKPVAPIVFNIYSMFVYYFSGSPLLVLCYIGLILCVLSVIALIPLYNYLHTIYSPFLRLYLLRPKFS